MKTKPVWMYLFLAMMCSVLILTGCPKKTPVAGSGSDESGYQVNTGQGQDTGSRDDAEAQRQRALEEQRLQEQRLEEQRMQQQQEQQAREAFVNEDVLFTYDSSVILPKEEPKLIRKAEYMKANSGMTVTIEGHCDERGTNEYNLALGERRAESAKQFMIQLGISPSRIETVSYGEERPVDPGHNESAWRKNRRAHFVIQ